MLTDLEQVWLEAYCASIKTYEPDERCDSRAEIAVNNFKKFREDQKKEREGEQERRGLD